MGDKESPGDLQMQSLGRLDVLKLFPTVAILGVLNNIVREIQAKVKTRALLCELESVECSG